VAKDRFKYAYDRTSNRTSRDPAADSHTPPDANDNYYTYDGLDRLVKSNWGTLDGSGVITDQNADANQAWSLDTVGNWSQFKWDTDGGGGGTPITQTRAHNTANEIAGNGGNPISGTGAANWVDPTYDPAGNMTAGPQPRYETADANTQLYVYDAWNRLTKIYEDANCNDMIDDPGELVATYSYDGQNRRIRKVLAVPNPDVTYDYYYNESWQVLEVRKGGDTDPLEQYVWGIQYVDAPVVRFRDGNVDGDLLDTQDNTDSTLYYTYDGNFNVTAVIKPDGTVAERYTYDPYGQVTFKAADWSDAASQAKSAYYNEILYCGYRFDPESGLFHVRNRYYHPTLGRWTTREPQLGHTQGSGYHDGMNIYQYGRGNPLVSTDSSGLVVTVTVSGRAGHIATPPVGPPVDGTLYGKERQTGTPYSVPVYAVTVSNESGSTWSQYKVTRDTADDMASIGDQTPTERKGKFGENHETPPGLYLGKEMTTDLGRVLRLHTPANDDKTLHGPSGKRTLIDIHKGPGMSKGCFLGQGGEAAQNKFMDEIARQLKQEAANSKNCVIIVRVEPR